jgi:hypothetical protein
MNYDSVKFCWQCQKPKPREGFGPVRPGSKRHACSDCRELVKSAEDIRRIIGRS